MACISSAARVSQSTHVDTQFGGQAAWHVVLHSQIHIYLDNRVAIRVVLLFFCLLTLRPYGWVRLDYIHWRCMFACFDLGNDVVLVIHLTIINNRKNRESS